MGLSIFKYVFLIVILLVCGFMAYNVIKSLIKFFKNRKKKKSEINNKETK